MYEHDKLVSVLTSCKTEDQVHSWLNWIERIVRTPMHTVYEAMGHNRLSMMYCEDNASIGEGAL